MMRQVRSSGPSVPCQPCRTQITRAIASGGSSTRAQARRAPRSSLHAPRTAGPLPAPPTAKAHPRRPPGAASWPAVHNVSCLNVICRHVRQALHLFMPPARAAAGQQRSSKQHSLCRSRCAASTTVAATGTKLECALDALVGAPCSVRIDCTCGGERFRTVALPYIALLAEASA